MTPKVSRIRIHPVKSLDPAEIDQVKISERSLFQDREFALFDEKGKYVNGKRTAEINKLRATYDLSNYQIELKVKESGNSENFNLIEDELKLNEYFSNYFKFKVFIKRNEKGRFLDIPDFSGLTIISNSTFNSLTEFFPEISEEQMRRRFRANIEVTGVESFWEDNLFSGEGKAVEYQIGDVKLYGLTPRARCIVPTRDPDTGNTYPYFTKEFVEFRKNSLSETSSLKKYDHFYYLTVDTFIPDSETDKTINTGDNIQINGIINTSGLKI